MERGGLLGWVVCVVCKGGMEWMGWMGWGRDFGGV
jgi:hypothetical protein